MGQVDALKMVEHVRTRLVDLAVSENYIRDKRLSDAAKTIWEGPGPDGGLVSELWVEGAFPGERSSDSLKSLSDEGLFPDDLCHHVNARDVFPEDRLLYNHQSETLRKAAAVKTGEKPAFVITAGTGLGKTEAFLLPMLSDLWTAPDRRKNGGMRCLILYPMNALVADQVSRIYKWLQGQERLSVFHFTSETPEDARRANKQGEPKWEPCRARTRQEARGVETHKGEPIRREPFGRVPDIVITNYSMLEYMLSRPQDYRFFGPDLRWMILDEAHLYSGTLAAEIMMLLRRVRERCGVTAHEIFHTATSATLGGDDEELQAFASSLFSADKARAIVIRGQSADLDLGSVASPPAQPPQAADIEKFADLDFETLTTEDELIEDNEQAVSTLAKVTTLLVAEATSDRARHEYPRTPARFLYLSIRESPLIRQVASLLAKEKEKGNVLSLDDLAGKLFSGISGVNERNATIVLLRLAATARMRASDLPLIPHRLHFLVRPPEGLSVCLNPECSGPEERKISPIGCLQPLGEGDRCRYCGHVVLPIHRCNNCGEWTLAAHENQETSVLEPGYYSESDEQRTYYLLTRPKGLDSKEVVVDSQSGEVRGSGFAGVSLWKAPYTENNLEQQQCPTCGSLWTPDIGEKQRPEWARTCQSLVGGRPFALSVTAETVLHDLPPYRGVSRNWKPAEGRRLLAFSDSRASAARLGPRLTQQHEMRVVRAAMARCTQDLTPAATAKYLAGEVDRLKEQIARPGLLPELKQHLEEELQEKQVKLQRANVGTSFTDYARLVAQRDELIEILDRDAAERHNADNYGQSDWERNGNEIRDHIEGLIAKELERPLKKRASIESVGLIEVVYPGIDSLGIPPLLEEKLSSGARTKIAEIWPELIALLLDSGRRDSCVAWSKETSGRTWLGESPLLERWLTRTRGGWGATAFVGETQKQLRRAFASNVLRAVGCEDRELEHLSEEILYAVFDQLFRLAGDAAHGFAWLRKGGSSSDWT